MPCNSVACKMTWNYDQNREEREWKWGWTANGTGRSSRQMFYRKRLLYWNWEYHQASQTTGHAKTWGVGSCSWCDRSALRKKQHEQPKDVWQGGAVSAAWGWEAGAYTLYGQSHTHIWHLSYLHSFQSLGPLTKLSAVFLSPKPLQMTFEHTADLCTGPSSKLEVESRNRGILSRLTSD